MKAEIISIGTELLLGEITDTNAAYLAAQLPSLGIDLHYISQVGDNQGRIVEVLERALGRSDLLLTTGGLGPTEDDVTREAIAAVFHQSLYQDQGLVRWVQDFFRQRGREMSANNLKQATLIPAARALVNERGTAPGWWVEQEGRILVTMPGPPRECQYMWETQVRPLLAARLTGGVIVSRTLKTWGLAESLVDEMVGELLRSTNPTIGVYARRDGVHLRLTAKATDLSQAQALLAPLEDKVRAILKESIWGTDDHTLEQLAGQQLEALGLTLATMESCTGGLLASAITDVPSSSRYYRGGLVAYSNAMKLRYGVAAEALEQYGAVSPQAAEAMAQAARAALGADVGLSTTGVAGPETAEGKPAGTVYIGIAADGRASSFSHSFPPPRQDVKIRTTIAALFHLVGFLRG